MHLAEVSVASASGSRDALTIPFGVRSISFNASHGLMLNGVETKLYGGCVHHDNGPLGAMAIDRAEERRVEALKRLGYNAVRTAHNPVSPAFLAACDKLGMLVMEEAFDCWGLGKNPDDYHLDFWEWWRRDMAALVLRDRNHPSIVMWSIGNEIPMRFGEAGANLSKVMHDYVHALDPGSGRAVTSAYPLIHEQDSKFLHNLDVTGYNYAGVGIYAKDHARLPDRVMVGTESVAMDSYRMWSDVWSLHAVIGDFIWTAIDYLGDSYSGFTDGDVDALASRHPWPWHISFCGDLDIVGHSKPQSVYRRVLWGMSPIGMLVHRPGAFPEQLQWWGWPDELESWSWAGYEGQLLGVRVFARGCEAAVLLLNGRPLAHAPFQSNFTAVFTVPFAPGTLEAVCVIGSTLVANVSAALHTTHRPASLHLEADRSTIAHNVNDLAFVTVSVVDDHGRRVPDAALPVSFTVSGAAGHLIAVGSGNPSDPSSFTTSTRTTWQGRALAILQPKGETAGAITLVASVPGLHSANVTVVTKVSSLTSRSTKKFRNNGW
mmetsp:Transcript_58349/g.115802  ORF Transcript_58349/g.115802 Transcript_58349/m.115802 type:complete len:546 (-) Transcript_58349:202-1839(-)